MLLTQLKAMTMELMVSTPERIIRAAVTRIMHMNKVKKAKSATILDWGTLMPLIFTGRTAFGCRIWRKLLRSVLSVITARIHLKPPLVLPAQAPTNIRPPRIIHVICGHRATSSLNTPVVVINETT